MLAKGMQGKPATYTYMMTSLAVLEGTSLKEIYRLTEKRERDKWGGVVVDVMKRTMEDTSECRIEF